VFGLNHLLQYSSLPLILILSLSTLLIYIFASIFASIAVNDIIGRNTDNNIYGNIFLAISFIAIITVLPLGIFSIIDTVAINSQTTELHMGTLSQITSLGASSSLSMIILSHTSTNVKNKIKETYVNLINRYKKRKGIEFIN